MARRQNRSGWHHPHGTRVLQTIAKIADAQKYAPYRETPKHYFLIECEQLRRRVIKAGRRLVQRGFPQRESVLVASEVGGQAIRIVVLDET